MISDSKSCVIINSILLGQFLSILLCGTGITNQYLQSDYGVNIPTAQSLINYLLLGSTFGLLMLCRHLRSRDLSLWKTLKTNGWKYFLVSLIDVEGSYLLVKAYRYTTLTSIQILDCFTLVVVVVLSRILFRVRYQLSHWLGILISIVGLGLLIYSDTIKTTDSDQSDQDQGSNKLLGDILCIAGASLYGIGNVSQEYLVKTFSPLDFLGLLGLFASLIAGVQLYFLEWEEILQLPDKPVDQLWPIAGLVGGFNLCMFAFYTSMPFILRWSNATAVNLSILSADFYSLVAGIFLFGFIFNPIYIGAFVGILVGVTLYHWREAPRGGPTTRPNTPVFPPDTQSTDQSLDSELGRSGSGGGASGTMGSELGPLRKTGGSAAVGYGGQGDSPRKLLGASRRPPSEGGLSANIPAEEWRHESLYPSLPNQQMINGYQNNKV